MDLTGTDTFLNARSSWSGRLFHESHGYSTYTCATSSPSTSLIFSTVNVISFSFSFRSLNGNKFFDDGNHRVAFGVGAGGNIAG